MEYVPSCAAAGQEHVARDKLTSQLVSDPVVECDLIFDEGFVKRA